MLPQRFLKISLLTLALMGAGTASYAADPDREVARDEAASTPAFNNPGSDAHIEGRIAYLKAELMITPQQENLWGPVAESMRADVRDLDAAMRKVGDEVHGHENTVQYLQHRVYFARLRADGEMRFLAAMRPLYESMSTQQKQAADALLTPDGQE